MPSLSVTVTEPSFPTVTFASSGKSLFASLTAFSTASFSLSVNLDGSFTATGSAGAFNSAPGVFAVAFPAVDSLFEPSLAFALTSVLSFTLSAGIVTTPEDGSIFRSLPSGSDQLP